MEDKIYNHKITWFSLGMLAGLNIAIIIYYLPIIF